jgi:hypothetical protein
MNPFEKTDIDFVGAAISSIRPNASYCMQTADYSTLDWQDESQEKPTEQEFLAALSAARADYDAKQYQRDRAAEYPPVADYLDGIVKGDQAQIDAYIAACQAVKAKYPKPE